MNGIFGHWGLNRFPPIQNENNSKNMYTHTNFKTKKALKDAVAAGKRVTIYAPGFGSPKTDGTEFLEGPHYPEPHRWYAQVEMKDGVIIKVK
jgi:hypothetical protein